MTNSLAQMDDVSSAIVLVPSLSSDQAEPLLAQIREASDAVVLLDARNVERVGGLCLQVLLSANYTLKNCQRELKILSPSASFMESLRILGAESMFDIEV